MKESRQEMREREAREAFAAQAQWMMAFDAMGQAAAGFAWAQYAAEMMAQRRKEAQR